MRTGARLSTAKGPIPVQISSYGPLLYGLNPKDQIRRRLRPWTGHSTKVKAKLILKPGGCPVYGSRRPVAFAPQHAVNEELDRWVREEVLAAVDHSNWGAPIVAKKSNG